MFLFVEQHIYPFFLVAKQYFEPTLLPSFASGRVGKTCFLHFPFWMNKSKKIFKKIGGIFVGKATLIPKVSVAILTEVGEDVLQLGEHHGSVLVLVVELAELHVVVEVADVVLEEEEEKWQKIKTVQFESGNLQDNLKKVLQTNTHFEREKKSFFSPGGKFTPWC